MKFRIYASEQFVPQDVSITYNHRSGELRAGFSNMIISPNYPAPPRLSLSSRIVARSTFSSRWPTFTQCDSMLESKNVQADCLCSRRRVHAGMAHLRKDHKGRSTASGGTSKNTKPHQFFKKTLFGSRTHTVLPGPQTS